MLDAYLIDTILLTRVQNVSSGLVTYYGNALLCVNKYRDKLLDTFIQHVY
jgi:hypothetical protein